MNVTIRGERVGVDGTLRYFTTRLSLRRGMGVQEAGEMLQSMIFNEYRISHGNPNGQVGDGGSGDAALFLNDQIFINSVQIMPTGEHLMYEALDDDDYNAHHKFQENFLEQAHSIKPLQMKDFSCVYESLMMIFYTVYGFGDEELKLPED